MKLMDNHHSSLLYGVKKILNENCIKLSKFKSQNFLINEEILKEEIKAGEINENDEVVEVGAGIGTLTKYLAKNAKKVIAVEKDKKFIPILKSQLKNFNNIEIVNEDILNLDDIIFYNKKIVSNPPYQISTPLLLKILQSDYNLCVITLQLEFGMRLIAKPGSENYNRLAIRANYNSNIKILRKIHRRNFYPMPKVDSILIRITPKQPVIQIEDEDFYFEVIRDLFIHKNQLLRKVIWNKIKKVDIEKEIIYLFINKLPFNQVRVHDLDLEQIKEIVDYIKYSELRGFWNI